MEEVLKIIKLLRETSSSNAKIEILKSNSNNELLKKVLYYTYYPHNQYKFSRPILTKLLKTNKDTKVEGIKPWNDIFDMLDELSKSNINNELKDYVADYLLHRFGFNEEIINMCVDIICKDLKIGVKIKSINKAFPNLIYEFNLQRAKPINDKSDKPKEGEWFALMIKYNGERGVFIDDELRSRQDKLYFGLEHIENELRQLNENGLYVIDGELLRNNIDNIDDSKNFQLTASILSDTKGKYDKKEIHMMIFDTIPTNEFKSGESVETAKTRIERLKQLDKKINELGLKYIHTAKIVYEGVEQSKIQEYLDYVDNELKLEGLVLYRDKTYKCSKNNHILKIKTFKYSDLKIVDVYEGNGEFEGMLGGIVVEFKNSTVRAGGGNYLTRENRIYWWEHREELKGRIAEIKYKNETRNKDTGLPSVQFPQWNRLREIGKEISYE